MIIAVDTNVLLRGIVGDQPEQAKAAQGVLDGPGQLALSLTCLCEFVWVLRSTYHYDREQIASILDGMLAAQNVVLNHPAVEAGLSFLNAGGDFADGVIAFEGAQLGAEQFVSFDRKAVTLRKKFGGNAELLV